MQEFSLRKKFENCRNFSDHRNGKGLKGSYSNDNNFGIWVVVKDEEDLLKSSKLFNKTFNLYQVIASGVHKEYKKEIGAYAHILDTIQGQMRQKMDDFAGSKEFYGETYDDSVKKVTQIVKGSVESAADLICYMQKRTVDMRAHLLGTEVIHSDKKYEIKSIEVSLRRAILNQCTPFLEGFEKNSVKIKFFFEDVCKIKVDKNMFSLVMYNFFSNAEKYAKINSEIRLNYSDEQKVLNISMISLKMDRGELADLHKEGVRGNHAANIPGKGIGLFVIDKALKLMGKEQMNISPNYEKCYTEEGIVYVENHFIFSL